MLPAIFIGDNKWLFRIVNDDGAQVRIPEFKSSQIDWWIWQIGAILPANSLTQLITVVRHEMPVVDFEFNAFAEQTDIKTSQPSSVQLIYLHVS